MITVYVLMDLDENWETANGFDYPYIPIKVFVNDNQAQVECRYLDPDGIKGTYIEEVEYINE